MSLSKELRRTRYRTFFTPEVLEDRLVLSAGEGSTFAIMPGSVDTSFGDAGRRDDDREWKISPEDVAETVVLVLRMPVRTMVSRVEMRPSRPKK